MRPQTVLSRYDYDYRKAKSSEVVSEKSDTQPNMSLSLEQMFIKFASGGPLVNAWEPRYSGDTLMPNVKAMDLSEQDEMARQTAHNIKRLRRQATELQAKDELRKDQELKELEQFRQFMAQSQAAGSPKPVQSASDLSKTSN